MIKRDSMISDELWSQIQLLLPQKANRWAERNNDRNLLDAILWVLYEGGSWRQLPKEFGRWNSAYRRYNRWRKDGTWKNIEQLLAKHPEYSSPLPPHKFSGAKAKRRNARKAAKNSQKMPEDHQKQRKSAKPKNRSRTRTSH